MISVIVRRSDELSSGSDEWEKVPASSSAADVPFCWHQKQNVIKRT